MFAVESWRESVIDCLLIVIEPLEFFAGQHVTDDGAGDDGTEGEVLEGVVWPEGDAWGSLDDEHGVFVAHSVTAFDIDAWFVGDDHPG